MIDVRPIPIIPTWTNRQAGTDFISKRLDRALVKVDWMARLGNMRSFIQVADILDHMPVVLSWCMECKHKGIPFKFNRVWLQDEEYNLFVHQLWADNSKAAGSTGWAVSMPN